MRPSFDRDTSKFQYPTTSVRYYLCSEDDVDVSLSPGHTDDAVNLGWNEREVIAQHI